MAELKIFSGNAHPVLAQRVVEQLGITLGDAAVGCFSDGETSVEITEHVRGETSSSSTYLRADNNNLMELMIMVDCLHRASAGRITAVMPYFGYARQDRASAVGKSSITAKVVADMLTSAGIDRVLTMDLHADQIRDFSMSL